MLRYFVESFRIVAELEVLRKDADAMKKKSIMSLHCGVVLP